MRNECTGRALRERVNEPLKAGTLSTHLSNPFTHSLNPSLNIY